MFFFDSNVAKVSVPFSITKVDDKREWYSLTNAKNENVISILMGIYYDFKDKPGSMSMCDNSYLSKSVYAANNINKNDLSCDGVKTTNILKLINKSNNSIIEHNDRSKLLEVRDIKEQLNNTCSRLYSSNIVKHSNMPNLDNTVIYNENYKSPDLSTITSNLFSPTSYRVENDKSNLNLNLTNMNLKFGTNVNTNLNNSKFKNDESEYLTTIDSFLEYKLGDNSTIVNNMEKEELFEITKKLKEKFNQLKDEQEKVRKHREDINKTKDSNI